MTITITDNDSAALTLGDGTVGEGAGTATVTATLDVMVPGGFTVEASTADGTATAGTDYTAVSAQTLSFAGTAGETQEFTVTVADDSDVEEDEIFTVSLGNLAGTTATVVTTDTAMVTITDNEPPTVTLGDETVGEGDGTITVTATLSRAFSGGFTVDASTADGTATAPGDYTAVSAQTLNFVGTAGETQEFTVTVADDSDAEGDETFTVSLGNLAGTTATVVTTDTATVTITDNDTPSVTLGDETVGEGDGTVTVTATLNNVVVSGGFTVEASTADGTATAGSDYTTVSAQTLSFAGTAGETQEFTVTVADDSDAEPDETFTVSLGNLAGTTVTVVTTDTATVTITDNEPPTVTLGDETVEEGAGMATVTATLSRAVGESFTVAASTRDGTATAGSDYTAVTTTMLSFAGTAGETQEFTVDITDDSDAEGDETFTVSLGSPAGTTTSVTTSDTATVTITDNDATVPLTLSLNPTSVSRSSGTATVSVTASVPADSAPATATEVAVTVAGGGANPATAGEDFTPVPAFTITLAAEADSATGAFVLTLADGDGQEDAETLIVSGTASGFVVAPATLTITDHGTAAVEALLPELAQVSVASVVDSLSGRIGQVASGFAGGSAGPSSLAGALAANRQGLNKGDLSLLEALGGSSVALGLDRAGTAESPAAGQAGPSRGLGVWASVDYDRISGKDAEGDDWDGDQLNLHAGVDRHVSRNILVGLAVFGSRGRAEFDSDPSLDTDTRLLGLNPYLGWHSDDGARTAWGTVGYSAGDFEQKRQDLKTDLEMAVLAVGGSGRLVQLSGIDLDIKGDLATAQVSTEAAGSLPEVRLKVHRARLALEVGDAREPGSGGHLARSVALGLRHDGGDGDTGSGIGLDGDLRWSNPDRGLSVSGAANFLLFHSGHLREWGLGGLIRYAPAHAKGRGLTFRAQPSYDRAESGAGQLWEREVTDLDEGGGEPEARLVLDAGWGLAALSGRGLLTPYGGLELSEGGSRIYRLGSRVGIGPAFHIDLAGHRTEDGGGPEHGIGLQFGMRW